MNKQEFREIRATLNAEREAAYQALEDVRRLKAQIHFAEEAAMKRANEAACRLDKFEKSFDVEENISAEKSERDRLDYIVRTLTGKQLDLISQIRRGTEVRQNMAGKYFYIVETGCVDCTKHAEVLLKVGAAKLEGDTLVLCC